jgi:hypothetical protein
MGGIWARRCTTLLRPLDRRGKITLRRLIVGALKRCTNCGEEKPPAEFSRDRSRKDGRYPQCKACVRRWHQENAGRLAEYNRRWREANRDKQRAWDRRYRERKRGRTSDAPPEANDG